jgi:hypothetical protein
MQRLTALGAKLANLFSDASSSHPTAKDSAHVEASLFESTTPTSAENAPVSTDVVVGHSSAFNSERATGMNKLQQLQFVEMLKEIIVGEFICKRGVIPVLMCGKTKRRRYTLARLSSAS